MPKMKFNKAFRVANDGRTVVEVEEGGVHDVADHLVEGLIRDEIAEIHVEKKPSAPTANKGESTGKAGETK